MDLVCVGDVMLDVHVASGALARGGDVHGRVAIRPVGTSANAAVWAAWAGATAAVIAAVGDDLAGALCVAALADRGVDVGGVEIGRASCRERGWRSVGAVSIQKKGEYATT